MLLILVGREVLVVLEGAEVEEEQVNKLVSEELVVMDLLVEEGADVKMISVGAQMVETVEMEQELQVTPLLELV